MKERVINLLPTASRFQVSQIRLLRRFKKVALAVLCFWFLLLAGLFSWKFFLDYQERKILEQKRKVEASLEEFAPEMDLQQALRLRLKLVASVLSDRPKLSQKIQEIESLLPDESIIKLLKIQGEKTKVNLRINNLSSLENFENLLLQLVREKDYSSVRIYSISHDQYGWNLMLELID